MMISIHALLAESDLWAWTGGLSYDDFYPRSPCGERRSGHLETRRRDAISIHALLAESDANNQQGQQAQHISIHALLAESDTAHGETMPGIRHFYPRSPCGERLISEAPSSAPYAISIHALLAESDQGRQQR